MPCLYALQIRWQNTANFIGDLGGFTPLFGPFITFSKLSRKLRTIFEFPKFIL
ncbi:hypothetical protein IC229_18680 [Spirosoma sp. BT702]|uniref:Uncharacterized protein n=1 Tax=Spirosoma profusum TaxID=2771354 RepID=A0A926XXG0_9BACT|nr:hypothetical protein [Spirosoma profusum]